MNQFFEVKVKFSAINEDGKEQKVSGTILTEAVNYSDAERSIFEQMPESNAENSSFRIVNMKPCNFSEMHLEDGQGKFYKCKIQFISLDETSGKEKKISHYVLIESDSVDEAKNVIDLSFQESTLEYNVISISETNIIEVLKYE